MLDDTNLRYVKDKYWTDNNITHFAKRPFPYAPQEKEMEEIDLAVKVDRLEGVRVSNKHSKVCGERR